MGLATSFMGFLVKMSGRLCSICTITPCVLWSLLDGFNHVFYGFLGQNVWPVVLNFHHISSCFVVSFCRVFVVSRDQVWPWHYPDFVPIFSNIRGRSMIKNGSKCGQIWMQRMEHGRYSDYRPCSMRRIQIWPQFEPFLTMDRRIILGGFDHAFYGFLGQSVCPFFSTFADDPWSKMDQSVVKFGCNAWNTVDIPIIDRVPCVASKFGHSLSHFWPWIVG